MHVDVCLTQCRDVRNPEYAGYECNVYVCVCCVCVCVYTMFIYSMVAMCNISAGASRP